MPTIHGHLFSHRIVITTETQEACALVQRRLWGIFYCFRMEGCEGCPYIEKPGADPEKLREFTCYVENKLDAGHRPRWAYVRDALEVGSTAAKDLCRQQGLDPDEMIGRSNDT